MSSKAEFKKILNLYKGKILTGNVINEIANYHEQEIGNMLEENGLHIESDYDSSKELSYGDGNTKDWVVKEYEDSYEYNNLSGALKRITREQ